VVSSWPDLQKKLQATQVAAKFHGEWLATWETLGKFTMNINRY
jgi:hypothetical protein